MAVTTQGTLLAFCEGRKYGASDSGKIDLVLKRSRDGGERWEDLQIVVAEKDMTCGNPCPVVDASDGTIWLPFCKNLAEGPESLIIEGKAPRTVWITNSTDDGATWSEPVEITPDVKLPSWTWYATGPGHGIQLKSGRLLIPCDHIVGVDFIPEDPYHAHIIYSDDHGTTWQIGGIVGVGTNECEVVETADGLVYINCRNYVGGKRRAVARSRDGGLTFDPVLYDETLVEPICQASVVRFSEAGRHGCNRVLFSNPASTKREKMTVRLSYDEGGSWAVSKLLFDGPAAYSDLAVTPDMTICCFYERGEEHAHETLTLARFNLAWLTDEADSV